LPLQFTHFAPCTAPEQLCFEQLLQKQPPALTLGASAAAVLVSFASQICV